MGSPVKEGSVGVEGGGAVVVVRESMGDSMGGSVVDMVVREP